MPSLQVVDLEADNPEPTQVERLFSEYKKYKTERKEGEEVGKMAAQYKQALKNGEDLRITRANIATNMDIGPTKRLELLQMIDQGEKQNNEMIKAQQKAFKDAYDKAQKAKKEEEQKAKDQAESKALLMANGMSEEEADEKSKIISPTNAKTFGKKPAEKLDKFDQTLQAEAGKEYNKLQETIAKGKDAVANLDHLENLFNKELTGPKGYAKSVINSESASEFNNLAFTSIEPIIKLFNPVGPIPVAKMKLIQEQFQMKAGNLKTTVQGKINALRRIAQQGLARNEARAALIKKHKGLVPEEELKKFDEDSQQLQDALVDQEAFNLKMAEAGDEDLVEGFYSADGRKLKPMPKKQAMKLYNEGLIKNVP